MLGIRDIYAQYQVPPWLQLHQLRVAAAGKMVAESLPVAIDTHLVVSACLLHDVGAIVKFDFTDGVSTGLKGLYPPEDTARWIEVQRGMRERYGAREYEATATIIEEIGIGEALRVFGEMGLINLARTLRGGSREALVAQYGDMRVGPYGILPLADRLADVERRYADQWRREGGEHAAEEYRHLAAELERRIFEGAGIRPADISDEAAAPVIEELWDYAIA